MKRLLPALLIFVAVISAGCSSQGTLSAVNPPLPAATATPIPPSGVARPVLTSSELVVGPNRFVLGLVDTNTGAPLKDVPDVSLQFFKLHDDGSATKTGNANVVYQDKNLPAGLYVAHTQFDQAGNWGALVTIKPQGHDAYQVKLEFQVLTRGSVPMIGDNAPPSVNRTKKDVANVTEICSARPVDDMHDLTIAGAIKSGKPSLVLFATPGFCESATCGPDLEVAEALQKKYGAQMNFIHIEVPAHLDSTQDGTTASGEAKPPPVLDGLPTPQVETMSEWGLKTEPWIFFIDRNGKIAGRFEGGLTVDELDPAAAALLK